MTVYAYCRVSSTEQIDGFGLDRQRDMIQQYAQRLNLCIDEWLIDEGVSGYHDNLDRGALSDWIAQVRAGQVQKDSVLIIESMDRFTRADMSKQMRTMLDVLDADIAVHAITESQIYSKQNPQTYMFFVMFGQLANKQSKEKSIRHTDNWRRKFDALKEQGKATVERS